MLRGSCKKKNQSRDVKLQYSGSVAFLHCPTEPPTLLAYLSVFLLFIDVQLMYNDMFQGYNIVTQHLYTTPSDGHD